jgi:hypothetical protein
MDERVKNLFEQAAKSLIKIEDIVKSELYPITAFHYFCVAYAIYQLREEETSDRPHPAFYEAVYNKQAWINGNLPTDEMKKDIIQVENEKNRYHVYASGQSFNGLSRPASSFAVGATWATVRVVAAAISIEKDPKLIRKNIVKMLQDGKVACNCRQDEERQLKNPSPARYRPLHFHPQNAPFVRRQRIDRPSVPVVTLRKSEAEEEIVQGQLLLEAYLRHLKDIEPTIENTVQQWQANVENMLFES